MDDIGEASVAVIPNAGRVAVVTPAMLALAACGGGNGANVASTGGGALSGGTPPGGATSGGPIAGSTPDTTPVGGATGNTPATGTGSAASGGGTAGTGVIIGSGIVGGGIISGTETGGAGSSSGTGTTPAGESDPIAIIPATITPVQASRFLAQATMGATRVQIDAVVARRYEGWIDDQLAMTRATSHWDWLVAKGYDARENIYSEPGFDATIWRQLIVEPDQLRQRVGMALLDFLVVGVHNVMFKHFASAAYVDLLLDHAFGNYRDIIGAISTNSAMGSWLSFLNNKKTEVRTGTQPDENYARELMQLFTLGTYQLNMDGTLKLADGQPLETYTQTDVAQLARVFTGLVSATADRTTPERHRLPLVMNSYSHETGTSTVLGVPISSGDGMTAIKQALDIIFAHPNVPPFISRQLIQRLVTSNPTPSYVGRVAAVFADNGYGVRGDMKAVIKAILLDIEARSDDILAKPSAGKLREPVMRVTAWARACNVNSASDIWAIEDTSDLSTRLGQAMGRSQSVFNFFRPSYSPPGTPIAAAGFVAPEFQITNEQSVVSYVNYMYRFVTNGMGDVKADYTALNDLAADSAALVAELNLVLAAGQLTDVTQTAIRTSIDSVPLTTPNALISRVNIALMLTLASPEFIVVK